MTVKRISHIAIVVPNIEEALDFYQDSLGLTLTHTERVSSPEDVIVAFLPAGDSEIELVEPVDTDSGVGRYLEKRGPGIHHICLEVADIDESIAQLKKRGVELINEEPTIGSGGKLIAFIHPRSTSGVLVELYQLTDGEALRRSDILEGLRERLAVESRVMTAGISAFVQTLRSDAGRSEVEGIQLTLEE
jgi:methylmalonyl-CoA/ethylmalonyl-CoA epimerase